MIRKFALALAVLAVSTQAQAFDLTVLGGLNFSKPSTTPEIPSLEAKGKFSYGALISWSQFGPVHLESGLMRINRKSSTSTLNQSITAEASGWEVPLLVRVYLPLVSVGAGGYFCNEEESTRTVIGVSSAETVDVRTDYGLKGSLRFSLPIAPLVKVVAEGQYVMGLKDTDNTDDTSKTRDIRALAGVTVGF